MGNPVVYQVEEFNDLPFDVSVHEEALRSFAALSLSPQSIRPALRARDLVFIRVPSCKFRFGITTESALHETTDLYRDGAGFEILYRADDPVDAEQACVDVERYFLRHYPGRTQSRPDVTQGGGRDCTVVYIACTAPDE